MPMHRVPRFLSLAALAALSCAGAGPAAAADIQGHAITYGITVEKPPAGTWVDGQLSVSLSKSCEAWTYSSVLLYAIDRNQRGTRSPGQRLSAKADSYQEALTFTEKLDGTALQYETRYHVNARGEDVRGTITLDGGKGGTMDVKSEKMPRQVDLPAGTLLPMTLRGRLIDAVSDPTRPRGTLGVRTIEVGRFYSAIDLALAPAPPLPDLPVAKGEKPRVVRSPLLSGKSWMFRQTSRTLAEWMQSTFELNESGVIPRFTFLREGIVWRADVKEVNAFTNPRCGG